MTERERDRERERGNDKWREVDEEIETLRKSESERLRGEKEKQRD